MELDSTEGTSQNSWSIGRRCKRGDAFSRPLLIIREAWPYCPSLFPPTIGCTLGASCWSAGGHSRVEIPVPIPNTEVKRSRADGTAVRPRESRSLPAFLLLIHHSFEWFFCLYHFVLYKNWGPGPPFFNGYVVLLSLWLSILCLGELILVLSLGLIPFRI